MNSSGDMSPYVETGRTWRFKIAGGVSVPIERVPFQGYLLNTDTNEVLCGATIISSLVILTAAHCLVNRNASSLSFVAGDKIRSTTEGTEQRRNISSLVIHEGFDKMLRSLEHDIGLAFLSSALSITDYVKAAGVASSPTSYVGTGTISGWGKAHDNGIYHDQVQAAAVPLVNQTECSRMWNNEVPITQDYICAYKAGVDACQGDSGGALSGYVRGELIIAGVIAAGADCGYGAAKPGIYINVSRYGSWIRAKIAARCSSDQFHCHPLSGKCIPKRWLCDGDNDCGNREDESNCNLHKKRGTCSGDKMWCPSSSKCIRNAYICDGDNDCGNNDDEINCRLFGKPSQCERGQFWCKSSSKCITINYVCDGDNDCGDNEDEKFCTFH